MAGVCTILLGVLAVALAVYCGTDPFKHSSMADFPGFEAFLVDLPHWSELPTAKDRENKLQKAEIRFMNKVQGPESVAFDPLGRGPYTGVADGRVLFWDGSAWKDFAYTSPNRSELCDPKPSAFSYLKHEHICGRPLGLRFDRRTGDLYIADAYFGLLKVGPEGGLATPLTIEAEGVPLNFTNDLDIDEEGNIYFTDSSTKYQRRNFMQLVFTADPSGRLLKYDPKTKETTVLLRDLQFPNGVSLSKDGSFFVFCEGMRGRLVPKTKETTVLLRDLQFPNGVSLSKDGSFFVFCEGMSGRLTRYWLKGEKAGTTDVFAILPGFPDNVRTNDKGEFWVAIHCRRTIYAHLLSQWTQVRKFLMKLPISAKYHYLMQIGGRLHAAIIKYSPNGELLEILEDAQGKVVRAVSEVEEKDGKLWIGSVLMPFIAVY